MAPLARPTLPSVPTAAQHGRLALLAGLEWHPSNSPPIVNDSRRRAPGATPEAIQREPDRRQVTVLFADVSGFTTLAERLDPEDVRAFQNALFDTLAQAIARYDGFVEKFVGDAVLAVFGAPVAHEDDPERALDTALDMLVRSKQLSEQWSGRTRSASKSAHWH